ncbi:MAG: hypothetical protein L0Y58_05600 [Verrucomicrobia subdivision 3 bacterium]|nr:hypothetical protein [Limisphaerales bacterium]
MCESLRAIVAKLTDDEAVREDLMQECLIHLWRVEKKRPGKTRSWYLQSCRFHAQHVLASGRSVDSLKRSTGEKRVIIDNFSDALPCDDYHTNGELLEWVSARDMVSTLDLHLRGQEKALLRGLADGMIMREIASELKLSYPTALKYRRKIAATTARLGMGTPALYERQKPNWKRRKSAKSC